MANNENDINISESGIKAVRDNADLYAAICNALDVAPTYLAIILRKKDARLTQMNVLKLISENTGIEINNLIEPAKIEAATA